MYKLKKVTSPSNDAVKIKRDYHTNSKATKIYSCICCIWKNLPLPEVTPTTEPTTAPDIVFGMHESAQVFVESVITYQNTFAGILLRSVLSLILDNMLTTQANYRIVHSNGKKKQHACTNITLAHNYHTFPLSCTCTHSSLPIIAAMTRHAKTGCCSYCMWTIPSSSQSKIWQCQNGYTLYSVHEVRSFNIWFASFYQIPL